MPLPVVIHLPTQLTIPPRILTRHVIRGIRGARLYSTPRLDRLDEAVALPRVGAGAEKRLAPRCRQRVAERREDHREEEHHEEE